MDVRMKVLLATDFSQDSQKAVETVKAVPWCSGTTIRILHVLDSDPLPRGLAIIEDAKRAATSALSDLAAQLRRPGLGVETEIVVDSARSAISNSAAKWGADWLVMGSHGRGRVARLLLGSVAQSVVRSASGTVEIVRNKPERPGMKVLVASDGSNCSIAAIQAIGRRPWPAGTIFRIVSVVPLSVPAVDAGTTYLYPIQLSDEIKEMQNQAWARAAEAIGRARELLEQMGLRQIEIAETLCDDPRRVIVEEVERSDSTVVVVGSHGWRGFDRFMLGSVSEYLVNHAPCSVIVVHQSG